LKAKACLDLEGLFLAGKANTKACNTFSQSSLNKASELNTNVVR